MCNLYKWYSDCIQDLLYSDDEDIPPEFFYKFYETHTYSEGNCIVVSLVRNTPLGLIINAYCNGCPRDEGTWSILDTKASGNTIGNVIDDMLSVRVIELVNFDITTSLPSFK